MKRILTALLAVIYLAITSGVVVNTHYCMGKKSAVKLQAFTPAKCGCGKKTESRRGCCKTELKVLKVNDAQKISTVDHNVNTPVAIIATELNLLQAPFFNAATLVAANSHSPPLLSAQDTYLRNCVFRI